MKRFLENWWPGWLTEAILWICLLVVILGIPTLLFWLAIWILPWQVTVSGIFLIGLIVLRKLSKERHSDAKNQAEAIGERHAEIPCYPDNYVHRHWAWFEPGKDGGDLVVCLLQDEEGKREPLRFEIRHDHRHSQEWLEVALNPRLGCDIVVVERKQRRTLFPVSGDYLIPEKIGEDWKRNKPKYQNQSSS